jgi:hypothetical protein
MDSAILEIVKLILIAVGGGVGAKVLDVILARTHGRLAVTLSDREELKAFIEEGRARERSSIQRETALETKIEFLLGENQKQAVQITVLQQEKAEREKDMQEMRASWAVERKHLLAAPANSKPRSGRCRPRSPMPDTQAGRRGQAVHLPSQARAPAEVRIAGDCVVAGDLHAQAVDWDLVSAACEFGKRFGITKAALVGDIVNFDAFSQYP